MTLQKLSIFLLDDFIAVFTPEQDTKTLDEVDNLTEIIQWKVIPIHGETELEHDDNLDSVKAVLSELNQRMNTQSKLAGFDISIIYSANCLGWLESTISLLTKEYDCTNLQISKWQDLLEYVTITQRLENPDTITTAWIQENILPITFINERLQLHKQMLHEQDSRFAKQKQQQQQAFQADLELAKNQHQDETAKLDDEKERLLQELKDIRLQLATVQAPNLENLVSYLPAIFKDFWNIIPPAELSIIAGKLDTTNIASPYRSPSSQAVLTKIRQFNKLDTTDQHQIISFCQQLRQQYTLQIHHEFKSVITEII